MKTETKKKVKKMLACMMVATTLVMAATGCSQKEAGTVSTDGSTSMEKSLERWERLLRDKIPM